MSSSTKATQKILKWARVTWGSSHRNSTEEEEINSLHDISSSYVFWKQQRAISQGFLDREGYQTWAEQSQKEKHPGHFQPMLSLLVWSSSKRFRGSSAARGSSQHKALSGLEIYLPGAAQSHQQLSDTKQHPQRVQKCKMQPSKKLRYWQLTQGHSSDKNQLAQLQESF